MSKDITVSVYTMGGEVKEIQTLPDMRIDDFINELCRALNLPSTDSEGNPISWRIDNKTTASTLDNNLTFEENQVRNGDALYLLRTVTAGGGFFNFFGERQDEKTMSRKEYDTRKVFVVHGRNSKARKSLFQFLRSVGLHPLEWSEAVEETGKSSPYVGEVLEKAFSIAQAAIILFTPDDEARLREEYRGSKEPYYEIELTGQARPNVIFEAGMAMGMFPNRTVLVELGELRPMSDIGGRHVIRLSNSVSRRQELAQRLKAAGCIINLSGVDWHDEGDFSVELLSQKNSIVNKSTSELTFDEKTKTILNRVNKIVYALENFNSNPEAVFYIGQTIIECESFLDEIGLLEPVENTISEIIDEIDNDTRKDEGLFDPIISIRKIRIIIKYFKQVRLDLAKVSFENYKDEF